MLLSFNERLARILDGRKLTPWGKELGLSNGVITDLGKGKAPGPDFLNAISVMENVSLSYLLSGTGSPFIVENQPPETLNGQIYFLSHNGLRAIVTVNQAEYTYERTQKTHQYQQVKIYRGTEATDLDVSTGTHYKFPAIIELLNGQIGNHSLIATNGLLAMAKPTIEPWHSAIPEQHNAQLLRGIFNLVNDLETQNSVALNNDQRARIISTTYTHALCRGINEDDLKDYIEPLFMVVS